MSGNFTSAMRSGVRSGVGYWAKLGLIFKDLLINGGFFLGIIKVSIEFY
jgi:hypothetical protein